MLECLRVKPKTYRVRSASTIFCSQVSSLDGNIPSQYPIPRSPAESMTLVGWIGEKERTFKITTFRARPLPVPAAASPPGPAVSVLSVLDRIEPADWLLTELTLDDDSNRVGFILMTRKTRARDDLVRREQRSKLTRSSRRSTGQIKCLLVLQVWSGALELGAGSRSLGL